MARYRTTRAGIDYRVKYSGRRNMSRMATDLRNTTAMMKRMAGGALALGGIYGLGAVTRQSMSTIDATAKLSDRLGMTTEKLIGMQHAAKINGVEQGAVNKSLEVFSKRLGEVQMGTGQAKVGLEALGLSAQELSNKSPDKAIGIVADQINRLETQSQKAAAANFLFGRSGQQLLNMFAQGKEGLAAYQAEAEKLGLTYSRIDAAKVEQANDSIARMQGALRGLVNKGTIALAPYLEEVSEKITEAMTSGENFGDTLVKSFEKVALGIVTIAGETEKLLRTMDKLRPVKQRSYYSDMMADVAKRRQQYINVSRAIGAADETPMGKHLGWQPKNKVLWDSINTQGEEKFWAERRINIPQARSRIIDSFENVRTGAQTRAEAAAAAARTNVGPSKPRLGPMPRVINTEGATALGRDPQQTIDRIQNSLQKEQTIIGRLNFSHQRAAQLVELETAAREKYGQNLDQVTRVMETAEHQMRRLEMSETISEFSRDSAQGFGDVVLGARNASDAIEDLIETLKKLAVQEIINQPFERAMNVGLNALFNSAGPTDSTGDTTILGQLRRETDGNPMAQQELGQMSPKY